jgi:hypothetical protein
MSDGYVYCFSNASMPGILKIGMTERTPDVRLREANTSDTWRPPTSYNIEFAKNVKNPKEKEMTIHILLEQYTERINPRREFFRVSPEEVRKFFDLMDGEMWTMPTVNEDVEADEDEEDEVVGRKVSKGCRDMTLCFKNNQRIRHTIGINKTWTGTYDSTRNGIVCDENFYMSLSGFAQTHYSVARPDRCKSANGWKECECEVDGKWVSTYSLPV